MAGPIVLGGVEAVANADILQGTRLQTVPQGGYLTFEMQGNISTPTDFMAVSIQMPNGDTPLNDVQIPAGASTYALNQNDKTQITLPVAQGGHTVFSASKTGSSQLTWRVTYTPA